MEQRMPEMQNIQWFPGHMTKTRRMIQDSLSQVDAAAEIIDARIPLSSRNPELDGLLGAKPRLMIMNKCDMADPGATKAWTAYFEAKGWPVLQCDSKSGKGVTGFSPAVKKLLAEKLERNRAKGMVGKKLRVMIVGIPNVGKSSFINALAKNVRVKVEDRPGVTRGKQWVSIDREIDLLDTPGVLWPKFEDQATARLLAFTGAVKDDILDIEGLAANFLDLMKEPYFANLSARYKLEFDRSLPGHTLLEQIGRRRGMMIPGGEVDIERAAIMLLDEYRAGKLGRITLEKPV